MSEVATSSSEAGTAIPESAGKVMPSTMTDEAESAKGVVALSTIAGSCALISGTSSVSKGPAALARTAACAFVEGAINGTTSPAGAREVALYVVNTGRTNADDEVDDVGSLAVDNSVRWVNGVLESVRLGGAVVASNLLDDESQASIAT